MLGIFTILHPIVDACSVSVLMAGGHIFERVLVYNIIAFALQLPLGMLLDARPQLVKQAFGTGLLLTAAGVVLAAAGYAGWTALSLACLGNALFHLTAGKHILDTTKGRSGPIGLFISTGAIGLLLGLHFAGVQPLTCLASSGMALAVCGILAWRVWRFVPTAPVRLHPENLWGWALLLGLFALIAWRSWAGLLATSMTSGRGAALMCGCAATTWAGKVCGGYLAERMGRWRTTAASVAGSMALCYWCAPEQTVLWLALLFVSQLATGPVLSLAYDKSGAASGSAFGLNCLGLFTGSLNT